MNNVMISYMVRSFDTLIFITLYILMNNTQLTNDLFSENLFIVNKCNIARH